MEKAVQLRRVRGLVGLAVALVLIAPFGVNWSPGRPLAVAPAHTLAASVWFDPINRNVMAGVMAVLLPLPLAMLGQGARHHLDSAPVPRFSVGAGPFLPRHSQRRALALGSALLLMVSVLLATRSRGAYIAALAAICFLPACRNACSFFGRLILLGGLGFVEWRVGRRSWRNWWRGVTAYTV